MRCLTCEFASGEDEVYCLVAEKVVGTLDDLMAGRIKCPVEQDGNRTYLQYKRPAKCKNSTTPECFGTQYSTKRKCSTCPHALQCSEEWSDKTWQTHKVKGYGRGNREASNSWDDIVRVTEGD